MDYSSYESVEEEEEEGDYTGGKLKSASLKRTGTKQSEPSALASEASRHLQNRTSSTTSKKSATKKPSAKPPPKGQQALGSQKSLASFFSSGR